MGHPTRIGTIVGFPCLYAVSQVFPNHAVLVVASVEKLDGADVTVDVTNVESIELLPSAAYEVETSPVGRHSDDVSTRLVGEADLFEPLDVVFNIGNGVLVIFG